VSSGGAAITQIKSNFADSGALEKPATAINIVSQSLSAFAFVASQRTIFCLIVC
jgi:hypothetical protein